MAYADLVTYNEVQSRAMEADATIDNEQAEVEAVIADISRRIESHLHRPLIAHSVTQRIYRPAWHDEAVSEEVVAWAEHWPVVEVLADDYSAFESRKIQAESADDVAMTYVAGYRRADQSLADLQAEVPSATVEPGVLPEDIRNVALRLVLFEVAETADDILGLGQREQAIGTGNALTVRGRDSGFQMRELRKLDTYKRRIAL